MRASNQCSQRAMEKKKEGKLSYRKGQQARPISITSQHSTIEMK